MAKQIDQATARKRLLNATRGTRAIAEECGDWRHIVKHILVEDMSLQSYGQRFHCSAPAMLDVALERLSTILK